MARINSQSSTNPVVLCHLSHAIKKVSASMQQSPSRASVKVTYTKRKIEQVIYEVRSNSHRTFRRESVADVALDRENQGAVF
jgi:hypothetical protein